MFEAILATVIAWVAGATPVVAVSVPAFVVGSLAAVVAFMASEAGFARDYNLPR